MVTQFLQRTTGNYLWRCPLCARVSDVGMDHFATKPHVKMVWHSLDAANARVGMSSGTYTNAVYGSSLLWLFKPCQPSLQGDFTAAVFLVDGQCFLLAWGSPSDYVAPSGWVTFLRSGAPAGSVSPSRVSAASFPLALEYEPVRAG
jgi:hypothetical protein